MRKIYQKVFLAIVVGAIVALPFIAMAAGLQLETTFPKAPSMQEIVTGRTQLPGIIRYVVDWSIIIAALVTVLALVMAGISYLTSRGRPEATKAAKDRIKNCIYGLLIIAGSFLVLQTINPQLTIMTIHKKTVTGGGVVMFTQAGLYGKGEVGKCYDASPNSPAVPTGDIKCFNPEAVFGFNTYPSINTNNVEGDTLETLIKAGVARYLNYDIANTITEFGKLIKREGATGGVASENFPLAGLGFFGNTTDQAEAKVFAYPETQFNVSSEATANRAIEYRPGGKIKQDGTGFEDNRTSYDPPANSPAKALEMKLINIYDDYAGNFKSIVPYYDSSADTMEKKGIFNHLPLSIRMQGGGPGVVLYADNGAMKNLSATVEDFNLSNVKFDNQAYKIELRNLDDKGSRTHDFLAILHSGYFFTGDVRMFLEKYGLADETKNEPPLQIPLIYKNCFKELTGRSDFWDILLGPTIAGLIPTDCKSSYYAGKFCLDAADGCVLGDPTSISDADYYYPAGLYDNYGNIPLTIVASQDPPDTGVLISYTKMGVNLQDRFGNIRPQDKASSLQLFELYRKQGSYYGESGTGYTDKAKKQGEMVCREVKLCTSKGYMGDCLVYAPNLPDYIKNKYQAGGGRYDTYLLPMAPMVPVPIPWGIKANVKTYDNDGKVVIKKKEMNFEDKIKSISIDGDCVVVLFENAIADMDKCLSCSIPSLVTESDACKGCWDGGGPGANSEVFTSSVADLTTHEISKCGGRETFGFGERKNCASSIAIFPIKKTNEE